MSTVFEMNKQVMTGIKKINSLRDRQLKIEKLRTESQLRCVEIDEKSQMRTFNCYVRRKYYDRFKKLELYEQNKKKAILDQKKKLKLYQAHGFHFRRDGKRSHQIRLTPNDAQKYEEKLSFHCIEDLIFTEDEIDIEKIITLHLITVQDNFNLLTADFTPFNTILRRTSARTLSNRRKCLHTERTINEDGTIVNTGTSGTTPSVPMKEHLNMRVRSDQEIMRTLISTTGEMVSTDDDDEILSSRRSTTFSCVQNSQGIRPRRVKRSIVEQWFSAFPVVYILDRRIECIEIQDKKNLTSNQDLKSCSIKENTPIKNISNTSESRKLLVNVKLIKLLNTVIGSLQRGNPAKITQLNKLLHSQNDLKQMLRTPKILYFLRILDSKLFLSRPESYYFVDNIQNLMYLQLLPWINDKLVSDTNDSSVSIQKSPDLLSSNWKLNLSTSQLSTQNKSSKVFDPADSCHLVAAEARGPIGPTIADLLSKRLRSNLQRHEKEIRKLKQLKETTSDEVLMYEKQLRSVQAQSLYFIEDYDEEVDDFYTDTSYNDVPIVAKPFTIRQSYCYACLNKYRQEMVPPKIPTLTPKRSNWIASPAITGGGYFCSNETLFLNNNISYRSNRYVNRILTDYLNNAQQNQDFTIFGVDSPTRGDESPTKLTASTGKLGVNAAVSPSIDSTSILDEGFFNPPHSVYSDQTFFRNSSWLSKLCVNDNELYAMVFKDANLRKLETKIAVKETQKRLEKFLNAP